LTNNEIPSLGILEVLKNPGYRQWLVDNAYEDLDRRFSWSKLAQQTEAVYQRVVQDDGKLFGNLLLMFQTFKNALSSNLQPTYLISKTQAEYKMRSACTIFN